MMGKTSTRRRQDRRRAATAAAILAGLLLTGCVQLPASAPAVDPTTADPGPSRN